MAAEDLAERTEFRGLAAVRLRTAAGAEAVVSLRGGQTLSWSPPGGGERLYLSERAVVDGSQPIRGGIPVCWPQFASQGRLPRHGLVRNADWKLVELRARDGYAMAILRIGDDDEFIARWPHAFALEVTVLLEADRLSVELEVENTGHGAFVFTGALHSYLRVREVEQARLEGLAGLDYRDATAGTVTARRGGEFVDIAGEVDRIYRDAPRPLVLHEPHRRLGIEGAGFPDVVVWNPWQEKCAALPDMDALDFRRMLCVESALTRPRELAAGETWLGRQTLVAL